MFYFIDEFMLILFKLRLMLTQFDKFDKKLNGILNLEDLINNQSNKIKSSIYDKLLLYPYLKIDFIKILISSCEKMPFLKFLLT